MLHKPPHGRRIKIETGDRNPRFGGEVSAYRLTHDAETDECNAPESLRVCVFGAHVLGLADFCQRAISPAARKSNESPARSIQQNDRS
ncbi:MAG TPA: hypothetical protein VGO84_02395, partial [Burkholderiales bacterium]|nr:hypothetical protein [Burkholderiales bacterium]